METFTSFPYKFNLGKTKFELEDGRVTWISPEGIESKCSLDGKMTAIAIFEDKNEYVMTVEYPDGFYCISHNNGMFGPFKEISDIKFNSEQGSSVVTGIQDEKSGQFPLVRA